MGAASMGQRRFSQKKTENHSDVRSKTSNNLYFASALPAPFCFYGEGPLQSFCSSHQMSFAFSTIPRLYVIGNDANQPGSL
jgi:hypothetical protein